MKEFTRTLYVKIEHEREPEDDFFIASDNVTDLSESEETVKVAVYILDTVQRAVNKTELVA